MKTWQIAIVSLLVAVTAGCQQNNQPSEEGRDNDNHNTKYMEVKQSVDDRNENGKNITSQDISRHLVNIATGVPQVKDATAIVTMGYAVVGIDVDKDVDRSRVGTIKYSVAEAMRNDRYGANAVVVADPDTVERLKEMGQSIREGRPISGVLDELADIVGRVMPQVPSDMMQNNRRNKPSPPQENQQQLPKKQQRDLEQEQKKQAEPGENKQVPNLKNNRRQNPTENQGNKKQPNANMEMNKDKGTNNTQSSGR